MWAFSKVLLVCFLTLPCVTSQQVLSNAESTNSIRQVLARYAISVDGKDLDALKAVFSEDIVANYSTIDGKVKLEGIPAIQDYLRSSLSKVDHQHALTTQLIQLPTTSGATATTYFIASFFGTGTKNTQYVTVNGKYIDELSAQADGSWKIISRDMIFVGPYIGDLTIFE